MCPRREARGVADRQVSCGRLKRRRQRARCDKEDVVAPTDITPYPTRQILGIATLAMGVALAMPSPRAQQASPPAGPTVVLETAKGTIEFETYPDDAPRTVAAILELVKKNF